MFGDWHEWLLWLCALLCMGGAVKLTDDFLDADYDLCRGERTLAVQFGRATLPYALLLGVVAVGLDARVALVVFFGSYMVGMFSTWRDVLPTRVPAYVEILVVFAIATALAGWQLALWGAAMMTVVDLLDDVVDVTADKQVGETNLAVRLGIAETLLIVLFALCTAVFTNAQLTGVALIAWTLLCIASELTTTNLWEMHDDDGGLGI